MASVEHVYTAIQTGGIHRDGSGNTLDAAFHNFGKWWGAVAAGYMGFRFTIPAAVADGTITDVKLRVATRLGAGLLTDLRVEQADAAAFATSGGRRVDTLWGNIGSTGEVSWDVPNSSPNNTYWESPDLSSRVVSAITVAGGGETTVAIIGDGGTGGYAANDWWGYDSAYPPELVVTVDVTPENASVTTTAPSVAAEPSAVSAVGALVWKGVAYSNGPFAFQKDGPEGSRSLDLWTPSTTPPAGGWPLLVWIHGGNWTSGDRGQVPAGIVAAGLDRGYAVASISYRLHKTIADGAEALATGNERSFPGHVHDIKVALRFLAIDLAGANTYNVNVDRTVLTGFSAGSNTAAWVAMTLGDDTEYDGKYPGSWPSAATFPAEPNRWFRPAHVNRSNTTAYPFDFEQNGDVTSGLGLDCYAVDGLFMFAGIVSLANGVNPTLTPNTDARFAISNARRAALSRDILGGYDTAQYDEVDLDAYIAPGAGTPTDEAPYLGKADVVPDFPIGYVQGTLDVTSPKVAQYDALVDALDAVGYITSAPTEGVTSATLLSYYETTTDHPDTAGDPASIAAFEDWLDAIGSSDASVTTTAPSTAAVAPAAPAAVTQDRAVTATAPSVEATLAAAPAAVVQDRSTTVVAPDATVAPGTATTSVTQDRAVTVTAPSVEVATQATAAVVQDRTVTLSAPTSALATAGAAAAVTQDSSVTTAAPSATAATAVAAVDVTQDRATSTTAPVVEAGVTPPDLAAGSGRSTTTTAPDAVTAPGAVTATVTQDRAVTVDAPSAGWAATVPTVTAGADRSTTTAAPAASTAPGTATTSVTQDRAVTVTAPSVDASTTAPSVQSGADRSVTTDAPGVAASAASAAPAKSQSRSVTTTAPGAGFDNGTATTGVRVDKSITVAAVQVAAAAAETATGVSQSVVVGAPGVGLGSAAVSFGDVVEVPVAASWADGAGETPVTVSWSDGVTETPVTLTWIE